jgi:hypothetical protein
MHLFHLGHWHGHLELDWNIWLIGVSWSTRSRNDIGIYFLCLNLQVEEYERHFGEARRPALIRTRPQWSS